MAEPLGRRIFQLRQLRHVTQAELENRAHLAPTSISKIERGTREVTIREAAQIAQALRVDITQLFQEMDMAQAGVCAALSTLRAHCSIRQRRAIAGFLQSVVDELVPSGGPTA
jgi:transcriptional regulator with XRE-family HTH domain